MAVRTRTRPAASPEAAESETYKVGYRKPPKETQFKKGGRGGPGRPKGSRAECTILTKLLNEKVVATVSGKRVTMTNGEAVKRRLIEKALNGHHPSITLLIKLQQVAEAVPETTAPSGPVMPALTPAEQRIFKEHLARMKARAEGGES